MIDNAKKHQKAFTSEYLDTARDSRQFWHMLDKVTGKKTIEIVEPLMKENNSYTFNNKEISDILTETHFDIKKQAALITLIKKQLKEKLINC